MAFARRAPLFIVLLIASSATAFVAPLLSKLPPLRRGCALARPAAAGARHGSSALSATLLPLDSVGQWAGFFLWSVPLPLTIGAMLRAAEGRAPDMTPVADASSAAPSSIAVGPVGVQRNLMWAFPSFSVLLADHTAQPPLTLSLPAKLGLAINSWAGLGWYLYYKWQIEDELKEYTGEGLGGGIVVTPFALGVTLGLLGEHLYGSLEGAPFSDPFSAAFYGAFAWIYVNQWILYDKINQLYQSKGLDGPINVWGLLVPGYNFVTGIRQIHFLSQYWALERGEEPEPDLFAALFPFATKPELGVIELFTNPELWIRWESLGVENPFKGALPAKSE